MKINDTSKLLIAGIAVAVILVTVMALSLLERKKEDENHSALT
jgi:hypothetical protein